MNINKEQIKILQNFVVKLTQDPTQGDGHFPEQKLTKQYFFAGG